MCLMANTYINRHTMMIPYMQPLSMTIAVFGGTGETGKEVVYQALKQGEKVVVLARTPEKMT